MACSTQQVINGRLEGAGVAAALFAYGDDVRGWRCIAGQHFRADQAIGDDDVGALEPAEGLDRQQLGVAGAGADENDFSGGGEGGPIG